MTVFNSWLSQLVGSSPSASDSNNQGFHWIISDGVVNGTGRNGNLLIRLAQFSYDSDYDPDSDSIASENQP